jgi:hypothetical protein
MGSRIRQAALQPEARGQAAFFIRKTGSQQRLPHTILQCHPLPHDGAPLHGASSPMDKLSTAPRRTPRARILVSFRAPRLG